MLKMRYAKTIKIFLIDGDPNGRMSCELSNWTGKAYKIPRSKVKDCKDRSELNNTGVYMLFGKNDEGKDLAYIGEAENVLSRLNQHLSTKDYWNEVIVFVSKDENLNKAHIKYLENCLHDIAIEVNRYVLSNGNVPNKPQIAESDQAEMEEFIDNIRILVNTLGHKIFEVKRDLNPIANEKTFWINGARGASANGEPNTDGFLVFKGSKGAIDTVPSMSSSMVLFRKKLITDGILIDNGEYLELTEDYIFSSPSTASSIMMGRNSNGLIDWKMKSGKTLKEFESL